MRSTARSKPTSPTHRVNRGGSVSSGRFWTGVFINCGVETIRAIPSMHSADCSTDGPVLLPRRRRLGLLRDFIPILGRAGAARALAHLSLSLIAALMGSAAAIVIAPLIHSA